MRATQQAKIDRELQRLIQEVLKAPNMVLVVSKSHHRAPYWRREAARLAAHTLTTMGLEYTCVSTETTLMLIPAKTFI